MKQAPAYKSNRLLQIYSRLIRGETLGKRELALQFHVTERSIQRDMEALREYLTEQNLRQAIVYDKDVRGYRLKHDSQDGLSNSEILAVCKILLESRSLRKDEMLLLMEKLIACCVPERSKKNVSDLFANEWRFYIPPRHDVPLLENLWKIGQAVGQHRVIEIEYRQCNGEMMCCCLEPVELMFSEYYFYLVGFRRDADRTECSEELCPILCRVDRIQRFTVTDERFVPAFAPRFREEEFRKRVQFQEGGTLNRVRFRYTGASIDTVLDRLPTAEIVSRDDEGWVVDAEVFGHGIDRWLHGNGDYVNQE